MAYPDYQQYQQDAKAFQLILVFATIAADFETPVTIFLKEPGQILIESLRPLGTPIKRLLSKIDSAAKLIFPAVSGLLAKFPANPGGRPNRGYN